MKNLAKLRSKKKLTQAALAELVGISQPAISMLENQVNRDPKTKTLKALAKVLGVKLEALD